MLIFAITCLQPIPSLPSCFSELLLFREKEKKKKTTHSKSNFERILCLLG